MSLLPDLSISVEPKIELIEQVVDSVIIEEAEAIYCEIYPADFLVGSLAIEEVAPIAGEVVLTSEALMTEEVIVAIEPIKEAVEPLVEIAIEEPEVVYCELYPADFLVESLAVEEIAPIAGEVLLASEDLVVEEVFVAIEPTLEAVEPLVEIALEEAEAVYCEIYPADFLVGSLAVEELASIADEVLLASEALMTEEVFVLIEPTLEALEPLAEIAIEEPEVIYCEIYPADFLVESLAVEEIAPIAGEVLLASETLMTVEVFESIEPTLEAVEPLVAIAIEEPEVVYCEIYPADFLVESFAVEEIAPLAGEIVLASEALMTEEVFVAIEPIKEAVEPILELVEPLVASTNYSQLFAAGSTAIEVSHDVINTGLLTLTPVLDVVEAPVSDVVEIAPIEVTAPVDELMTTTVVEPVLVAVPDINYQDDLVVVEPSIAEPVEAVVEAPVNDVVEVSPVEAAAPVDELMTITVVDEPVLVAVPDIIYQDDLVVVEPSIAEPVEAVIETPVSDVVEVSPVETATPVDELMTITVVDEPVLVAIPDIIYQDDLVVVEPSIAEPVEAVIETTVSDVVEVFPAGTDVPVDEILTTTVVTSVEEPALDTPVLTAEPTVDESISILPILELAETSAGTTNTEDPAVVSTEIDPPVVSIDDLLTTDDVVVPTVDEVITTAVGESAETPTPVVDEAVYDVPHGLQVTSELLLPTPIADTNHSPVSPRIHLDFMITTLNLF